MTIGQVTVVVVIGFLGVLAACASWVAVVGAINSRSDFDIHGGVSGRGPARAPPASMPPASAPPPPPSRPVVKLGVWQTAVASIAVPGDVLVAVSGLLPQLTYELRLSYLGSPPMRFSMSVLSEVDAAAVAKEVASAPSSGSLVHDTRRRLLDCERILFTSYASEGSDSTVQLPPATGAVLEGDAGRTLRIFAEPGAAVDPTLPKSAWSHSHFVLSVRPVLFGAFPVDAVPVLVACVVGVLVMLLGLCWCLRKEVQEELGTNASASVKRD